MLSREQIYMMLGMLCILGIIAAMACFMMPLPFLWGAISFLCCAGAIGIVLLTTPTKEEVEAIIKENCGSG